MPQPSKTAIKFILIGAFGLVVSSMLMTYFTYAKFETALQELQTAYTAEQAKTKELTQKAEGLSLAMEQAQARVNALEKDQKASQREKGRLVATARKLQSALQGSQKSYAAQQAKTKKLTRRAQQILQAMKQEQARVKTLKQRHKASELEKRKLQAKATKLERALQRLRRAYTAQQAKTKKLTQKAEELLKTTKPAQRQAKVPAAPKGSKPETALEELQMAYAAEQAKTKKLTQKAEELLEALRDKGTVPRGTTLAMTLRSVAPSAGPAKTTKLTRDMAEMLALVSRLRAAMVGLHHALGVSYTRLGIHPDALRAFQMALELDPSHAESHFDLARVYIEYLDDQESAAPHFRRYVQLRPESNDVERIEGWLMKVERELKTKQEVQRWGTGFFQGLYKTLF